MITKEVIVSNKSGLLSKPAAMFIQKASSFKSSVWIEKGERTANAKSLLGLLSLSIGNGSQIIMIADGDDEGNAINELEKYINECVEEGF